MTVPSSVSAAELADYMHGELGRIAQALSFTVPASYSGAIVKALMAYGVDTIASATNVPRLYALASVEAWRLASQQLTPQINTSTDGRSQNARELFEHCQMMLEDAQRVADSIPDDGTGVNRNDAGRVIVRYIRDPYS